VPVEAAQSAAPGYAGEPVAAAPAYAGPVPSYATHEDVIRGSVAGFDGKYSLSVRDERGYLDNVTLREGTIINPTGLRLAVGMNVTIRGFAQAHTFVANQIDTPYTIDPPANPDYAAPYAYAPYPAYYGGYGGYGGYYGYGYPGFGLGWAPWFGIGISFGPYYYGRGYYGCYYCYRGGYYGYRGGYYGGYRGGYYGGYRGGYYGGYNGGYRGGYNGGYRGGYYGGGSNAYRGGSAGAGYRGGSSGGLGGGVHGSGGHR